MSECFVPTEFSHENTGHDEERSKELKAGDISPEDELVEAGCHDSPEAAQDDPYGGWNEYQPGQVDVVIDGVDDGGEEEFERSSH